MNVTIVGAGTAGFVTALILKEKHKEKINVKIIKSKDIGIIGVGEGSTEHWHDFMKFVNITPTEIIKECGATFKFGIMFEGWSKKNYLHSVNNKFEIKRGQEHSSYLKISLDKKNFTSRLINKNLLSSDLIPNQYHFDTFKLNNFLEKKCLERKIKIIDDIICEVLTDKKGIKEIRSKKRKYKSDLFVDCTGFKRVLIKNLGSKWKSYKKYLKLNSAITFQTKDENNYNLWTLAKAMKNGWRFKIPVQGRHGNGYIFCDKYTSPQNAKDELEKELGYKINIGKHIKFNPGRLEKVWIKNCVAIGLSANFVEPLEATSIGTSIQQAYLLMHNLNFNKQVIENYNNSVEQIMENIRDFIILHYLCGRKDTKFWSDISKIKLPKSLKHKLNLWNNRFPIDEDFQGSDYKLFTSSNFIQVLNGLNIFNRKNIIKQYSLVPDLLKKYINDSLDKLNNYYRLVETKTHKQFIEEIIRKESL